jgi:hypothetical protein
MENSFLGDYEFVPDSVSIHSQKKFEQLKREFVQIYEENCLCAGGTLSIEENTKIIIEKSKKHRLVSKK